jgi:hypothetical protein
MSVHREIPVLERRHLRRRCVQCGLSADAISATSADECPRCGCNLTQRPPRSYAEMEGLFDLPAETGAVDAVARARWDAAAARWLLVVGGAAVLAVAALVVTMMLAGR